MRPRSPLLFILIFVLGLAGCGMKGDLYEPPPATPVDSANGDDADEGERRAIPATPAPGQTR